ncbi:TRAP transporter small permease [Paracandidimonas soli]|uniref:TRAP transporter small permease protein n=1 Tax=Paracandidimonas soli TaxID=1917182 RepID=A0A4R3USG4_9BURK|nr:TRAP transporter small permease [Paracandidimonas soli]TCU93710.1 TRAP-type C4-dicarboxylate transport system permease small subunit [Paracandidimonas soli]
MNSPQPQEKGASGKHRLNTVLGICMAICLTAMAVLVFGNVILRYLFNSGITWSEEMSRYFFVFMIFFGSASAAIMGKHISVDLLVRRLAPGNRRIVLVIANLLSIVVLAMLAIGSWELAEINRNSHGPVTGFPLWLLFAGCLGMAVCMAVVACRDLLRALTGASSEQGGNP